MHATPAHAHGNEKKSDQSGHVQNAAKKHFVESAPRLEQLATLWQVFITVGEFWAACIGSCWQLALRFKP